MLDSITPLILTYDEESNIGRVLDKLQWAKRIVVLDSYSTDRTLSILKDYSNVDIYQRQFDTHSKQWNYGLNETGIDTDWVLALDADYVLTDDMVNELMHLQPSASTAGYESGFIYCVQGKPLSGTLYVPVTVLYLRIGAEYKQDGHTQRISLAGDVKKLQSKILHDDRKPLSRWLWAQDRYMTIEAELISSSQWSELGLTDKVRKLIFVAPFASFLYCLILKGGLFDGWAGFPS